MSDNKRSKKKNIVTEKGVSRKEKPEKSTDEKEKDIKLNIKKGTSYPKWARIVMIILASLQIVVNFFVSLSMFLNRDFVSAILNETISISEEEILANENINQEAVEKVFAITHGFLESYWIIAVAFGLLATFLNIFILVWGIKNTILPQKKKVIVFCILSFCTGFYSAIIATVQFILVVAFRRKNKYDYLAEKAPK